MDHLYSRLYGDGLHDDTSAFQALLDASDRSIMIPNGTYLISRPLQVHDNTCLCLASGAVMHLADGANCAIIENDALPRRGTNKNIEIHGGIWDGNNQNQVRRSRESRFALTQYEEDYYYGIFMRFVGVEDLHIHDLTIRNPESYAMLISNIDRFTVKHITFDYNMLRPNMDGVHVQGTARNGRIIDIKGATNDDLVALNCDDVYASEITRGNIENVVIDGLFSDNGYTAVRLLSCGSAMKNIAVRNVFGTYRYYGVSFTHHNVHPGEPIWFDNILVDGVFASKAAANGGERPIIWFAKGISCGTISLSNIHRLEETVTAAPTIQIDEDVAIDRLRIQNAVQTFTACAPPPLLVNNGTVKTLIASET
ncbi:MAG: glycoside hydrolase family 55 protein [Oscillospiraceae bacterium]|jgi:polygalacturonase|nr:glycoside hydrolase family 55 protein [Oscillospiraceae bacterium]